MPACRGSRSSRPRSSLAYLAAVALLGALATALLSVVLKRVSGGDGAVAINFWSLAASVLVFGIPTRFYVPLLPVAIWGWVFVGACSTLAMRFCYVWAYRAGDASAVEVGSVALLVWGAVVGLALFGEFPAPRFWIGALIMIVGIGLVLIESTPQPGKARSK